MARRKAAALPVPGTTTEALAMIAAYVDEDHDSLLDRLNVAAQITAMKAELAARQAAREERQNGRFASLKAWWEATGAAQFAGKKRSAEVGGARLGVRLTPPALKLPKGVPAADVLDGLMNWLGGDFIRTSHALDKEAIIAALRQPLGEDATDEQRHDRHVLAEELGLAVVQTDEFFIDTGIDTDTIRKDETAAG